MNLRRPAVLAEPGPTVESPWRAGRRAVVLVLVVAVPVVFDTTVRPIFALPKFTVAALGALLLVVMAVVERALGHPTPGWRNDLEVPVLVLVGWAAVSAVASPHPGTSVFGARESVNGLATALAFTVVFFATVEAFDASRIRTALSVLWFGAGGVVLLYGAIQLRDQVAGGRRWDPIRWLNTPADWAVWSTLGNPNDLAGFLGILLPVGLVLLALAREPLVRGLTALMVVLLMAELAVTRSRGALLGATTAVVVLAYWFRRHIRRGVVAAVGAAVASVALVATILVAEGPAARNADDLLATGEGTTAALRLELWRTASRMAGENAVFGVGPDGFGRSFDEFRSKRFVRVYGPDLLATDPHNIFLGYLSTQGIPGLLAFCFLCAAAVVLFRRTTHRLGWPSALTAGPSTTERQAVVGAVGAALIAYVVQASVNRHDIALDFTWWVLLGLLCALGRGVPQPAARRGRSRAATATTTATAPTASATHEIALPASSSSSGPAPDETSTMSLHHS